MSGTKLLLVLGDQLTSGRGALREGTPGRDTVVMAEVATEATYVPHNRHKIAFIFSAMRHFRDRLRDSGFDVIYFEYTDGKCSLLDAVTSALAQCDAAVLRCTEPGEHRLLTDMRGWRLPVPVEIVEDDRFLCSRADFEAWAEGRRQLRMELFYRKMRARHGLLIEEDGGPAGGKWNCDAQNRAGWRAQEPVPQRPGVAGDTITEAVIALVEDSFPGHPGDLGQFYLGVAAPEAEAHFQWFLDHALPLFGKYQDALAEESPWLFHSIVSMYLNVGLLDPLTVCRRVESAWREGRCDLAAAEGFIRQILGWREYVRGVYWLTAPEYARRNGLIARRPLPGWFWSGDTDMRCLQSALRQTLDLGYAHHIQRLMVIGNFALLAGLDVEQVCEWYLAVYVDAFEWVELPNTLGMALHADGGFMASKPYAASGRYIQRQGNHCRRCRYDPAKVTGEGACPYNSLYWHFLHRHLETLEDNPRMGPTLANWRRKLATDREAILRWADGELARLAPGEPSR
jgi:deoxyribodipyrimidine photolyase-related protein